MVRIVRAVLRLQAESGELPVVHAFLAALDVRRAGGVKLDRRLVRQHFHVPSALLVPNAGSRAHGFTLAQHEVVVVSARGDHLRTAVHDLQPFFNHQPVPKIQRRVHNGHIFSGGNQSLVNLGNHVRVDRNDVILHRPVFVPAQVEVRMIRQVAQRGLVRRRLIPDAQVAHVVPCIGHRHVQVPGIVFLSVRGNPVEGNGVLEFPFVCVSVPEVLRKSDVSAMKVVHPVIVQRNLVFRPVNAEFSPADPVAVAADRVAEAAVRSDVPFQGVKSQRHVVHISARVRHDDGGADRAPFNHRHGSAHGVGHRKLAYVFPLGRFSPHFNFD